MTAAVTRTVWEREITTNTKTARLRDFSKSLRGFCAQNLCCNICVRWDQCSLLFQIYNLGCGEISAAKASSFGERGRGTSCGSCSIFVQETKERTKPEQKKQNEETNFSSRSMTGIRIVSMHFTFVTHLDGKGLKKTYLPFYRRFNNLMSMKRKQMEGKTAWFQFLYYI